MDMKLPEQLNAYIASCPVEVSLDVYGRENRIPIHDAIQYICKAIVECSQWCNNIGLCVVNGELCVMYNGNEPQRR